MTALLVGQAKWTRAVADGLNRHTDIRAEAIAIDTVRDGLRMLAPGVFRGVDVILRIGFRPGADTPRGRLFDTVFEAMNRDDAPVVYYWLGTDVLNLRRDIEAGLDERRFRRMAGAASHLADSEALAADLREMGVDADVAWLPAPNAPQDGPVVPLPERPTVLTYVPDARSAFYDGPTILEVARRLPQVRFRVVGGTGSWADDVPPNVEFLGWRDDMATLYDESTVLVRLAEHDSVSCMAVEALAHGRHVIYSREFPHAVHVGYGDADGLEAALRDVLALPVAPLLPDEAVDWARRTAEPSSCYGAIASALYRAVEGVR